MYNNTYKEKLNTFTRYTDNRTGLYQYFYMNMGLQTIYFHLLPLVGIPYLNHPSLLALPPEPSFNPQLTPRYI